jgi:hypothetical protein
MDKDFRWISILLAAEQHKKLAVMALDKGIHLGVLGRKIFEEFLKDKKWQSRVM